LHIVPARDVARILNNESNLKILDRLKARPYYPRELAHEMALSEPFVVRRLKAMEEEGIVEGRWETEGSRKVKRYYLMDVKIEYGKEGLKVTSEEIPTPPAARTIDLKKELIGRLIKLPLMILFVAGVLLNIPAIIGALLLFIVWYTVMTIDYYRRFRFKSYMLLIPVYLINSLTLAWLLAGDFLKAEVPLGAVIGVLAIGMIYIMLFQARYYQLELDDILRNGRQFVEELEDAPVPAKILYLPMVIRWKISEYFHLV
jgi:DNA-binding transcriptional ArsR family regulator